MLPICKPAEAAVWVHGCTKQQQQGTANRLVVHPERAAQQGPRLLSTDLPLLCTGMQGTVHCKLHQALSASRPRSAHLQAPTRSKPQQALSKPFSCKTTAT